MSTISYMDEPRESRIEPPVSFEPTYQLGPEKHFPVTAVKSILKDVVVRHLDNRQYEPEFCKETTKVISEVILIQSTLKVPGINFPFFLTNADKLTAIGHYRNDSNIIQFFI